MAKKNNPVKYLQDKGFRITSDPNEYRESYPNGKRKPWGKRDLMSYGINADSYCGGYHRAYDFSKHHNAGIPAIANAKVAPGTGWNTFGWTLVLTFYDATGKHYQSILGHLNKNPLDYLKIGQTVKQGQIVAYQGRSNNIGVSNMASHLHIQWQNYGALAEQPFTCNGIDPLNIDVSETHATKSPKAPAKPSGDKAMIIDVSHHQAPGSINYKTLAKHVDHVIIRTMDADMEDRAYKTHHNEFRKQGVPTAAYAFVRGQNDTHMRNEAKMFWNRTKDLNPSFWWLDVEAVTHPNMRHGVSVYLNELRRLGAKKVGLYIAHHLYKQMNLDVSEADAVWIPHYGSGSAKADSKPAFPTDIHQYTEHGRLPGYNGNLDLNRIISDKKLEYFTDGQASKKKPSAPSKPASKPSGKKTPYTVGSWKKNKHGTQYIKAVGTFTVGGSRIMSREASPFLSAPQGGWANPGFKIKYDELVRQDGHVWIGYTQNGKRWYLPYNTWNSRTGAVGKNGPWGTFS